MLDMDEAEHRMVANHKGSLMHRSLSHRCVRYRKASRRLPISSVSISPNLIKAFGAAVRIDHSPFRGSGPTLRLLDS